MGNKKFLKPTFEEFSLFVKELCIPVSPNVLFYYFERRNWTRKDGKQTQSWKALVNAYNILAMRLLFFVINVIVLFITYQTKANKANVSKCFHMLSYAFIYF